MLNGLIVKNNHSLDNITPYIGLIPMGTGNALYTTCRQNLSKCGKEVSIYDDLPLHMDWCTKSLGAGHVTEMEFYIRA